jgi:hypothetical protein
MFETQGVKNVGDRYAAQGGSNTHMPAVATPRGMSRTTVAMSDFMACRELTYMTQATPKILFPTRCTPRELVVARLKRPRLIRKLATLPTLALNSPKLTSAMRRVNEEFVQD